MPFDKRCEHCGDPFVSPKRARRFCSKQCSNYGVPRWREADGLTFYARNAERIKAERRERYASDDDYRKRVLARLAARKAFPDGQPCEVCGELEADRHHDDYDKPLDIRWLCRPHHIQQHAALGPWGAARRAG